MNKRTPNKVALRVPPSATWGSKQKKLLKNCLFEDLKKKNIKKCSQNGEWNPRIPAKYRLEWAIKGIKQLKKEAEEKP